MCHCGNATRLAGTTLFRCRACRTLWKRADLLGPYIGHAPDNILIDNPMSCPECDGTVRGEWHWNEDCADFAYRVELNYTSTVGRTEVERGPF